MRIQLIFIFIAIFATTQFGWTNTSHATIDGIEPIVSEQYNNTDPPTDNNFKKVEKKEKKGLGKIFNWIKKKSEKVLSYFGIGTQSGDFSIIGFLLGFLLGLIGVLLAYIFLDKGGASSAWIGFGVWIILLLVFLFV